MREVGRAPRDPAQLALSGDSGGPRLASVTELPTAGSGAGGSETGWPAPLLPAPGEPERSEDLWRGGWLHTGDVGVIDAHGYLKIVDRIKDVVKTGGEWVSSLDIEDLILRVPGIAEAAVVGIPDDKWGERPVAFVVAKSGADKLPTEQGIREQLYVAADNSRAWQIYRGDSIAAVQAIVGSFPLAPFLATTITTLADDTPASTSTAA